MCDGGSESSHVPVAYMPEVYKMRERIKCLLLVLELFGF